MRLARHGEDHAVDGGCEVLRDHRAQNGSTPRMKQVKGANYRLVVRKSPIEGDGVFAGEEIPWGRKIIEYRGAVISDKEAQTRIAAGANAIMELGRDQNIDGFDDGNGAALVNHSRESPNCFLLREKGKVWLVAGVEGIKAGEELTYDYGSDYYPRKGKRPSATAASRTQACRRSRFGLNVRPTPQRPTSPCSSRSSTQTARTCLAERGIGCPQQVRALDPAYDHYLGPSSSDCSKRLHVATTRYHLTPAGWASLDIASGHVNLTLQHATIAARMIARTPVTIFRSISDIVERPSDAESWSFCAALILFGQ